MCRKNWEEKKNYKNPDKGRTKYFAYFIVPIPKCFNENYESFTWLKSTTTKKEVPIPYSTGHNVKKNT